MINILVVSDTHGRYFALEEILERQLALPQKFRPTHLIHLGDGVADVLECKTARKLCTHIVKGNCDDFFFCHSNGVPDERLVELGGYKILIMHGNKYSVKSGDGKAIVYAASCDADLLLYGHTHRPVSFTVEKGTEAEGFLLKKDLLVMNPGSLGYDGNFGVVTLLPEGIYLSHGNNKKSDAFASDI